MDPNLAGWIRPCRCEAGFQH